MMQANPALALLKKDHDTVEYLFDKFEKAQDRAAKKKIADEALIELKLLAALEEQIFYPAIRTPVGTDIMNEADQKHHVVKVLIAELECMDGREDHYDAKLTVLAEHVRHHIWEEENDVFPKASEASIDFEALSDAIFECKQALLAGGVPLLLRRR
jgi:5-methylcytosine-specific restriction endonuclease McrBC GTP-binding regulatory subunit McrB